MSRQFWTESLAWSTADGTAVTASATETIAFPNVTVPANFLQDGRQLECWAWGRFSTTTGPPTLRFRVRWGGVAGTLLLDSGTITTVASVTGAVWKVYYRITTRANGSSGSLFGLGECILYGAVAPTVGSATGAPAVAAMSAGGILVPAAVTVDLTADAALSLTATWSGAGNSLTGHNLFIDSPN
jgi:hypothetical protein